MKTKICSKCKPEKSIVEFHKGNDKDGLAYECKTCRSYSHKKQYEKNKENIKKYYLKNKIKIAEIHKKYRKTHKELIKSLQKEWYLKNKKKIIKNRTKYITERRKIDINFNLVCRLRSRLQKALKGINKSKHTLKLLGCSIEFFKQYYESKFTPGMSWKKVMNGEIHCDHIRPCASFDLSKVSEQKKCFNYKNLQPLWAEENIIKSDKYIKGE